MSTQLAVALSGLVLCSTLVIALVVDRFFVDRATTEIGQEFTELAIQTTDKLDRSLFERYREMGLLANQAWLGKADADHAEKRRLLDAMQGSYAYYAWMGLTDAQGKVMVSTKGLLEGVNVAQRPWFKSALDGVHLTDVHHATLLSKLLQPAGGEPMRFIDIAFPYRAPDGSIAGVFGAHLNLAWARDIEQSVMQPLRNRRQVDTLVLARDMTVLLGPPAMVGRRLALPDEVLAGGRPSGHATTRFADGARYLVGFSRSQRDDDWARLGWTVMVVQHADAAFAPVAELRRQILGTGAAIALLFAAAGLLLARRIVQPLGALAAAALQIAAGKTDRIADIPCRYREIGVLRDALNDLIGKQQASAAAMRQADRRKDEFLATLAHELRNPLAPISSAADLLAMANPAATQQHKLSQVISRQIRHMTGLIDDLLDVSRITRGQVVLERQAIDLHEVIRDAVEQVDPKMVAKRHRLALRLDPRAALVMGDKKRLVQIVANLLDNAAKYTPAEGEIALTLRLVDQRALLSVQDNGIGMSADLTRHAFELFTQETRKTDRSSGGLGVGLALSKRLVLLHDGTLSARSDGPDRGSELLVSLPLMGHGAPGHPPQETIGGAAVPDARDNLAA